MPLDERMYYVQLAEKAVEREEQRAKDQQALQAMRAGVQVTDNPDW